MGWIPAIYMVSLQNTLNLSRRAARADFPSKTPKNFLGALRAQIFLVKPPKNFPARCARRNGQKHKGNKAFSGPKYAGALRAPGW